ncbi:MAG: hypothetical protein U5P41_07160 [Gammaproteobacteria bacterium]|nr:hypothetical protein [Gammaproteobacteria bacterium]
MMEISNAEMKQRRIMVATPMFGGQCCTEYQNAISSLIYLCAVNGLPLQTRCVGNDGLITAPATFWPTSSCDRMPRT